MWLKIYTRYLFHCAYIGCNTVQPVLSGHSETYTAFKAGGLLMRNEFNAQSSQKSFLHFIRFVSLSEHRPLVVTILIYLMAAQDRFVCCFLWQCVYECCCTVPIVQMFRNRSDTWWLVWIYTVCNALRLGIVKSHSKLYSDHGDYRKRTFKHIVEFW